MSEAILPPEGGTPEVTIVEVIQVSDPGAEAAAGTDVVEGLFDSAAAGDAEVTVTQVVQFDDPSTPGTDLTVVTVVEGTAEAVYELVTGEEVAEADVVSAEAEAAPEQEGTGTDIDHHWDVAKDSVDTFAGEFVTYE